MKEDKSIDFSVELIDDASSPFPKLESSCSGWQGLLNPPSPLSCLRTLCCWLGQKLLTTPVGFPVLGKSPYCLQTSKMLLALLEKHERKRGGKVENSTSHSRLSCKAGSEDKKIKFLLLNIFDLESVRNYLELTQLSILSSWETCADHSEIGWFLPQHKLGWYRELASFFFFFVLGFFFFGYCF